MSNNRHDPTVLQLPVTPTEEWQLTQLDLIYRAIQNKAISHVYYRLYCALIDAYPAILTGEMIEGFQPSKLREVAGGTSRESVTRFLQDMLAVGAVSFYDPGKYSENKGANLPGKIQGNPDIMPYPETFLLSETDQRKKERDAQRARNEARYLILNCQQCGSPELSYQLVPTCKKCGFKHSPIGPVDVERISLKEEEDSFMSDMPTTEGETPSVHTEAMAPVQHPQAIEAVKVPHCQHWQCATGSNKTQVRMWTPGRTEYYCSNHGGYIDEQGRPL